MCYVQGSFEMTVSKVHVIAVLAAIMISTVATSMTAISPAVAQQSSSSIYIVKHDSNSYTLSGGSSSVGSFDTTYRIVGERSIIKSSENLVISTVTDDFKKSPTIGYVKTGNMAAATSGATLPNPFASQEQITERITSELRRVITEAESGTSQGQHVEIKCNFGMTLEDMHCNYSALPQGG